eukprot:jgi/Picsp_1/4982/NSC_02345-R1_protein
MVRTDRDALIRRSFEKRKKNSKSNLFSCRGMSPMPDSNSDSSSWTMSRNFGQSRGVRETQAPLQAMLRTINSRRISNEKKGRYQSLDSVSGPRLPGQGCQTTCQEIASAICLDDRTVVLKITMLAAGFVIGPKGRSIRAIAESSNTLIESKTVGDYRQFLISGEPDDILTATKVVTEAVNAYKSLTEGDFEGTVVQPKILVCGIQFQYLPPPKHKMPNAASLSDKKKGKSLSQRSRKGLIHHPGPQIEVHHPLHTPQRFETFRGKSGQYHTGVLADSDTLYQESLLGCTSEICPESSTAEYSACSSWEQSVGPSDSCDFSPYRDSSSPYQGNVSHPDLVDYLRILEGCSDSPLDQLVPDDVDEECNWNGYWHVSPQHRQTCYDTMQQGIQTNSQIFDKPPVLPRRTSCMRSLNQIFNTMSLS